LRSAVAAGAGWGNDLAVTVVDAGLHAYLRDTGRAFAVYRTMEK